MTAHPAKHLSTNVPYLEAVPDLRRMPFDGDSDRWDRREYAILLMKYPVMMLRSNRCQFERQPTDAVSTSFEGQKPYNGSQTQSSDAVIGKFLYVSNPVSDQGVP